jgi:hypothetical protein
MGGPYKEKLLRAGGLLLLFAEPLLSMEENSRSLHSASHPLRV